MKATGFLLGISILALPGLGAAEGPRKVSQAEALTAVVNKVTPDYPAMARQLKIAGAVTMEIVIGEAGSVETVNSVSGNPVLTKAAGEALRKWKFKPFSANGAPVKAQAQIVIDFSHP
jgi:protein TonB